MTPDDDRLRSALFVPGTRPERFQKALDSGADAVIIDLEDSVAQSEKANAREHVVRFAAEHPGARFLVRVNEAGSPWFADDLKACGLIPQVKGILVPKAESAEQIARAAAIGRPVLPIIESAQGLAQVDAIAAAAHITRLTFGALDLMLDLNITPDTASASIVLNETRCRLLIASRLRGLKAPLDTVYPDITDAAGLAAAAQAAHDMGFCGMLCIHPAQIPIVHQAFTPSVEQTAWAQRVVEHAEATGSSAFKLDGKMVDRPVIERARRTLRLARH